MKPARTILLTASLAVLGAPISTPTLVHAADRVTARVLEGADAVDDQSYARPLEARVTHVALDLEADMAKKRFAGTATLDIMMAKGATSIVLDALELDII